MPKGRHSWGRHLLGTAFGMAAGVLVAVNPGAAVAQPNMEGYSANATPVAAPSDLNAYRHPTLASNSTEDVEVQLVLAMDSSGSMSDEEWKIQLQATAAALLSTQVRSAIRCKSPGGNPSVAIAVVDFSDQGKLRIPWVDLRPTSCTQPDPEFDRKIEALAAQIATLPRDSSGSTHLGNMMEYTLAVFANAPWQPTERRVLDISGDGKSNGGVPVQPGREALMKFGVTINGIAIVNEEADLDVYYRAEVVSNPTEGIKAEDGRSTSVQGQVWEVAKNLQSSGNMGSVLFNFGYRLESALKQKISMETSGIYDQRLLDQMITGNQLREAFNNEAPQEPRDEEERITFVVRPPYTVSRVSPVNR